MGFIMCIFYKAHNTLVYFLETNKYIFGGTRSIFLSLEDMS